MSLKDSDERATPLELFNPLNEEFHFDIDVCAFKWNTKLPRYFSPSDNGLKQVWAPLKCFMNPPYSQIPTWLNKARAESVLGALVVAILPCDSSTRWFHEYIWDESVHNFRPNVKIRYPTKRYKFENYANSAKFATMIAIFCPVVQ